MVNASIDTLRGELTDALRDLDGAVAGGDTGGVSFGRRAGQPWITVPKLERQPEPVNLDRLKAAVQARWGTVDLLDFLAEADHHVGLVDCSRRAGRGWKGTGAYGAALSRYLRKQDVVIVEVDRSDRKTRRHKGKSVLCALRGRLFALRVHHDARGLPTST